MTKKVLKAIPLYKLEDINDRSIEIELYRHRPGLVPFNYDYHLKQVVEEWENMGKPEPTKDVIFALRQKTGLGLMAIKKEILAQIEKAK